VGIPEQITRDELCRAIEAFGFDPSQVRELHVYPDGLRVSLFRLVDDGVRYVGPNREVATVSYDIGVSDVRWD
jgi:hypothetical protein